MMDKQLDQAVQEALAEYEMRQNTIDDFYPSTKAMIDDLLHLVLTKMSDFLEDGRLLTKARVLEALCDAIRYVKTFAYGGDFQGEH